MTTSWLILDANYLCHRARYSMGELTWKGAATGVIYGFLQSVIHLQERFNTDRIVFCFDSRFSKRKKIYPAYKANRKNRKPMTDKEQEFEQEFHRQVIKLRMEYLPAIGFRNILWQQGYEADDLIAVACFEVSSFPDWEAIIVTADQDLYQCIRGNISTFNPYKNERMTLQRFYKTYHIEPRQWVSIKSIAGCLSDNIPGAKGIGEKTALKFVQGMLPKTSKAYQTIRAYCLSPDEKVAVTLVTLPLAGTKTIHLRADNRISKESWNDVCKHLGFKTLHPRIPKYGNQR